MPAAAHPLVREIQDALSARRDPERAGSAAAYMKVALPFLGVPVPEVRKLTKALAKVHAPDTAKHWQACIEALFFEAAWQEERYAACALTALPPCRKLPTSAWLPLYAKMITTAAWWDLVDDLSRRVGELRLREPEKVAAVLRRWAKHKDPWLRRAAIIAQRGDKERIDAPLLYDCIEPSLGASDFFLRKGIGWALRDRAYTAPLEVKRYVDTQGDRLSPLSRREALKHLR